MKKHYVLTVAFSACVALGSMAQHVGNTQVLTKTKQIFAPANENRPDVDQFAGSRAPGDTIWQNDFSNPSDWAISNEVGNSDNWVIGTSGPSGAFPNPDLISTSGGNWALYDSDLMCSGNQIGNLVTASPINLSSYSGVLVQFEQHYRRYVDSTYVVVSTDGTNWTKFDVNQGIAVNASTTNPQLVQINISAVAGGEAAVWIGFQFYSPSSLGGNAGCSYAWQVDDVALVEAQDNDLVIGATYYGDVFNDWEYATTPLAQAVPVYLGAIATNNGAATQTSVACEYDITLDGNSVSSGSFAIGSGTLAPAESDTGWFDTGFTPDEVGTYTVTYTITSDASDANPNDNESTSAFDITMYEWSHEREDSWDGQYGGYIVPDSDPEEMQAYAQGSVFYPVQDADLYGMRVSFGSLTSATTSAPMALTMEIHEIGASIQDIVDSEVQGVEISDDGWQTFVFDSPYLMTAGTGYILAIRTEGGDDIMTINGWGVDADFGAANYGPFGTGGAENWYNGWDYSSAIRALFDPTIGVEENEDLSGVHVYPNPATDNINVRFVAKEDQTIMINVIAANGALVMSEQRKASVGQNNTITFDATNLTAGIYMVQMVGTTSSLTQRVVVQ